MQGFSNDNGSPLALSYAVPETNITVEITGYANGQYVVRLLGPQQSTMIEEKEDICQSPLISVSVLGHQCFGEEYDVPAWKVRESLMERIKWSPSLD
jgi:cellobiose-specific phosphotransferase system component IIB